MDVKLPELSSSMGETKITMIYVNDGQAVKEGDALLDVENEKVSLELPAPRSGVVDNFKVKVGDVVSSEQIILEIRDLHEGEQPAKKKMSLEEEVAFLRLENSRLLKELENSIKL